MAQPILEVDSLTLESRTGPIVSVFSLNIHEGEMVALTGRSGIGKSSIGLAILQLLPPGIRQASGTLRWKARESAQVISSDNALEWANLRGTDIGYVQQDVFGAFDPVMPMGKQMLMIIRERTRPDMDEPALQLRQKMEEVGLSEIERLWSSYPHQLSGGQLQRCLIAMAIVMQPRLLISDEPTSAIDSLHQRDLVQMYARVRDTYKMAMLIISHEETVVRQLADRVIVLPGNAIETNTEEPGQSMSSQPNPAVLLKVENVKFTHAFGGLLGKKGAAIGPFTFTLHPAHCLGIVGASGSGKSTLAQLLVGLLIPDQGSMFLGDEPLDLTFSPDISRLRAKVQLVMQDGRGALHPYRTIQDQLSEVQSLVLHSGSRSDLDPGQALEMVGLAPELLDRVPGRLSGGECLRVNIARALMIHPEVLICDESTASLDPATRDGILVLLNRLKNDRGLSLVMISHDDHVMRVMADQLMVLSEGVVVDFGAAGALMQNPGHPISRQFFTRAATV